MTPRLVLPRPCNSQRALERYLTLVSSPTLCRYRARSVAATLGAVAATTGLVSRVGSTTSYCFDHDLARDGILADLGEFALELHQKVGVTLSNRRDVDPAVVAYQFAAARAYEGGVLVVSASRGRGKREVSLRHGVAVRDGSGSSASKT